jgi:hypothetical protein
MGVVKVSTKDFIFILFILHGSYMLRGESVDLLYKYRIARGCMGGSGVNWYIWNELTYDFE